MGKNLEGQIPPPQWVRELPFKEPPCPYCGKELTLLKELNQELIKTSKLLLVYCYEADKKLIYREKIERLEAKAEGEGGG